MKKDNILIIILIVCCLIISLATYYAPKDKLSNNHKPITKAEENITSNNNETIHDNNNSIKEDNTSNNKSDNKEQLNTKTENKSSGKINTNNNNNNTANSNSNNNNTSYTNNNQQTAPKEPEYYCPDGYSLNGTQCNSIIPANRVCPANTTEYSPDYCINLSEGEYTEEDSCPAGYAFLSFIGFGVPTKYKCIPFHNKIYTCDDGYNLSNTNCIKTITASIR